MKLLVFGASGATGKQVLQQALEQGHTVTAFVRDPSKLEMSDPHLKIIKGDVLHPLSIDLIMPGHDAVLCCLGAPANKAFQLRSEGTKNILASMEKLGVKRFICQTSLGYDDSEMILTNTSFVFRRIIVPLFLKTTFAEHAVQEKIIRQSRISWTIIRPGNMTNDSLTGRYKYDFSYADKSIKVKIARADVAHFMLAQLGDNRFTGKAVGISY